MPQTLGFRPFPPRSELAEYSSPKPSQNASVLGQVGVTGPSDLSPVQGEEGRVTGASSGLESFFSVSTLFLSDVTSIGADLEYAVSRC